MVRSYSFPVAILLVTLSTGFVHAQESAQGMHSRISNAAAHQRRDSVVEVGDAVVADGQFDAERKDEIARLQAKLRDPHRADYVTGDGPHRGSKAALAAKTKELKARVDALKKDKNYVPELTGVRLDACGRIPRPLPVIQVVDKSNMIVEWWPETWVWIKGIATTGVTDSVSVHIRTVLKVTGTRTYHTAIGGSKTIFVLEPFTKTAG